MALGYKKIEIKACVQSSHFFLLFRLGNAISHVFNLNLSYVTHLTVVEL